MSGQTHFCRSHDEWLAFAERLKLMPCPHCHTTGNLNRHGTLRGFDDARPPRRTIRARRVYCSNRHRRTGCGRTFSVWNAEVLPRRSVPAERLWRFLQKAVVGSLAAAVRAMSTPDDIGSTRSVRTWQRLWTRFDRGQSAIRTALLARGPPPVTSASVATAPRPHAAEVLAHLQTAFPHDDSPLAAYQHAMRTFVL